MARTAAEVDPEAVVRKAEGERQRRRLTRRTGTHGTDHWRGDFNVEHARGAWDAVTALAKRLVRDGRADTLQQARADAMMELILGHCDIKVVIHNTRAAEESGAAGPNDLVEVGGLGAPGTTFVPRDWLDRAANANVDANVHATGAAHDLTCDRDTGALLTGDVPEALASGRTTPSRARSRAEDPTEKYRIPAAMARLVRLRDGSCRFPGCSTPARQCDLDHVRAWPEGPTATRNLMALCRRHHRIKQRLDWRVSISPDATVTWWDPTGHEVTTRPVDHLHLVSARTEHSARAGALIRGLALLTTFEEQLHDLLDGDPRQLVRAGPHVWDADGTLLTGPPPKVDLESGHGPASTGLPEFTVALDHWPPSAPPGPDVIPF